MMEYLILRGPYLLVVILAMVGTYLILSFRNLLKAVVGLYVFQVAIILLFISLSFRSDASVPIVGASQVMHNPLPHAMMLTAIVVGVATLGLALAILRRIQAESGTIDEREDGRPGRPRGAEAGGPA